MTDESQKNQQRQAEDKRLSEKRERATGEMRESRESREPQDRFAHEDRTGGGQEAKPVESDK